MPPHRVQRPNPRTRKEPVHKTSRRELHPIQRAFLCGALLGGASQQSLSRDYGISQATLSRTYTRLKSRAAELGIDDLSLSDPRLIREAPKLFEDQNRRGRKELLTPEQRAMVVAVATRSKEAMKAKSSKFVGMRKLPDGTIERTMDPELVALGLPQMSTSTFEGCMYEAGYVRTKEGWKKVGGAGGAAATIAATRVDSQKESEKENVFATDATATMNAQVEDAAPFGATREVNMHDLSTQPHHDHLRDTSHLLDPDLQGLDHSSTSHPFHRHDNTAPTAIVIPASQHTDGDGEDFPNDAAQGDGIHIDEDRLRQHLRLDGDEPPDAEVMGPFGDTEDNADHAVDDDAWRHSADPGAGISFDV